MSCSCSNISWKFLENLEDPLAMRMSKLREKTKEQVSKEVDAMFESLRSRYEKENPERLDQLAENIKVVKEEGIVIHDCELIKLYQKLASRRREV